MAIVGKESCRNDGRNTTCPILPLAQVNVRMLQTELREGGTIGVDDLISLAISGGNDMSGNHPKASPSSSPMSPLDFFGRSDSESNHTDDDNGDQEDEGKEEGEFSHHDRRSYEIIVSSSSGSMYDLLNSFTDALSDRLQLTIKEAHVFSNFAHNDGIAARGHFVVMQEEGSRLPVGSPNNHHDPQEDEDNLKEAVVEIMRACKFDISRRNSGIAMTVQDLEPQESDDQLLRNAVKELKFGDFTIDFDGLVVGARIGGGSSGDIHRGTYHAHNVAIKIMNLEVDDEELRDFSGIELLRLFNQEVSTMRAARHKNLIQFIGAYSCWPKLYIVTELMSGNVLEIAAPAPALTSRVESNMMTSIDEDLKRSAQILRDAARGMDYLHQKGIMHRDLKAANLLVDDGGVTKVSDFGLAKKFHEVKRFGLKDVVPVDFDTERILSEGKSGTRIRSISTPELRREQSTKGNASCVPYCSEQDRKMMTGAIGTVKWMAPEVLTYKPYDHKSDVYSFGILMWELVTKEVPYAGLSPRQAANGVVRGLRPVMPSSVPPKLARLAEQCWHENPEQRPEFSEIAAVLEDLSLELLSPPKNKSLFRTKSKWLFSRGG